MVYYCCSCLPPLSLLHTDVDVSATELGQMQQHFVDQVQYLKLAAAGTVERKRVDTEQMAVQLQVDKEDMEQTYRNKLVCGCAPR